MKENLKGVKFAVFSFREDGFRKVGAIQTFIGALGKPWLRKCYWSSVRPNRIALYASPGLMRLVARMVKALEGQERVLRQEEESSLVGDYQFEGSLLARQRGEGV